MSGAPDGRSRAGCPRRAGSLAGRSHTHTRRTPLTWRTPQRPAGVHSLYKHTRQADSTVVGHYSTSDGVSPSAGELIARTSFLTSWETPWTQTDWPSSCDRPALRPRSRQTESRTDAFPGLGDNVTRGTGFGKGCSVNIRSGENIGPCRRKGRIPSSVGSGRSPLSTLAMEMHPQVRNTLSSSVGEGAKICFFSKLMVTAFIYKHKFLL